MQICKQFLSLQVKTEKSFAVFSDKRKNSFHFNSLNGKTKRCLSVYPVKLQNVLQFDKINGDK